jgi:hypothetical protein
MAAAGSVAMTADGSSDSWENNKANQVRLGNEFLKHISTTDSALSAKWGQDWVSVSEEAACSCEIYEHFATFLCFTYKKTGDKWLAIGSIRAVWGGVIQQAYQRFKASTCPETKVRPLLWRARLLLLRARARLLCCNLLRARARGRHDSLRHALAQSQAFFECLRADNSPQLKWYNGMKQKMVRLSFERATYLDEPMDNSAEEIYLAHVRDLTEAYALAGSTVPLAAEAAERKLAIMTLWRAAGRGGEAALVAYTGMKWNRLHGCTCLECPQPKSSKLKNIPFPAGIDRHSDWLLCYGDHLCMLRGSTQWASDKKVFLMPDLVKEKADGTQSAAGASEKIGTYLKAMQSVGGLQKYANVAIDTLPAHPTAAGLRPGAADTLCMSIQAELAIHITGHDGTKLCALWNYLDARVQMCIPGAIVLAGWPPLPYGHMGKGPVHPTLAALKGVSLARLDKYIDTLFSLHDNSPPMLHIGGRLRPMMHAMFATMIMYGTPTACVPAYYELNAADCPSNRYYHERFKAGEMPVVLQMMRDSYVAMAAPTDNVHDVLIGWGDAIKVQFNVDNLHLTKRLEHDGSAQMVTAISQLADAMGRQHTQIAHTSEVAMCTQQQMGAILQHMAAMQQQMAAMTLQISAMQQGGPMPPVPLPPLPPVPLPPVQLPPVALPPAAARGSAQQMPMQRHDVGGASSDKITYTYTGKTAARFYYDCMDMYSGNCATLTDSQRQSDAEYVFKLINSMASHSERAVLTQKLPERDDATCHRIVLDIVKCVQARIIEELKKKGEKIGTFDKFGVSCNAVLEKGKKSGIVIDSSMFAAWRNPAAASSSQPLMSQFGQSSVLGKRPAESVVVVEQSVVESSPVGSVRSNPARSMRGGKSVVEVNSDGQEVGSSSSESD